MDKDDLVLSEWMAARTTLVLEAVIAELDLDLPELHPVAIVGEAENRMAGVMFFVRTRLDTKDITLEHDFKPLQEARTYASQIFTEEEPSVERLVWLAQSLLRTYLLDYMEQLGQVFLMRDLAFRTELEGTLPDDWFEASS